MSFDHLDRPGTAPRLLLTVTDLDAHIHPKKLQRQLYTHNFGPNRFWICIPGMFQSVRLRYRYHLNPISSNKRMTIIMRVIMTTDIDELSRLISPIAAKYGVKRVYIFGSRAWGDYTDDSDYDLSIVQGDLVRLRDYLNFIDELESVLKCKVDVVCRDDVGKSGFYQSMISSEILIYGWKDQDGFDWDTIPMRCHLCIDEEIRQWYRRFHLMMRTTAVVYSLWCRLASMLKGSINGLMIIAKISIGIPSAGSEISSPTIMVKWVRRLFGISWQRIFRSWWDPCRHYLSP